MSWQHALWIALLSALFALWCARWWRRRLGSWRARRRSRRAVRGEHDAAALLTRAGYKILATQARLTWTPLVDGEPHECELHADYIVEAGGEVLVAEVKTGEVAPSLATAATRRQLLEYVVAWQADGVLLVTPEQGKISRVAFPLQRIRNPRGAAS